MAVEHSHFRWHTLLRDERRSQREAAFGFEDHTLPDGVRYFGHNGGAPGMNGRLCIFPESGYVVVVLANLDPPAADSTARFIDDRLAGEGDRLEPSSPD